MEADQIGVVVVGLVVSVILIAYLTPVALEAIYTVDTGNWSFPGDSEDTKTTGLFELTPLLVVLVIVILIVGFALKFMR